MNNLINEVIKYIDFNKRVNNIEYLESIKEIKEAIETLEKDFNKLKNKEV